MATVRDFNRTYGQLKEAIKTLRMNIEFSGIDKPIRSVAIVSTGPTEGKSTVSACLAIACGEAGKSVVVVENDLRRARQASIFKVRAPYGITDVLYTNMPVEECIAPTGFRNVSLLDVNGKIGNPVEVLSSKRHARMIEQLKKSFDFIIVDTPPIGMFIDAAITASCVDGVILVVDSGNTVAEAAKKAVDQLKKANVRILGVVLNGVRPGDSYYSNYYSNHYYYSHYYSSTADGEKRTDEKEKPASGSGRTRKSSAGKGSAESAEQSASLLPPDGADLR